MNDVFAGPTSFLALASLRQAVRLACLAAASPEDVGEAAGLPGGGLPGAGTAADEPGVAGVSPMPWAIGNRLRHIAAARVKDRLLIALRIALTGDRTDEARMKLA